MFKQPQKKRIRLVPPPGQALVEFLMVLPILVFIFLTAFVLGMAMFQATTASSAIQEPVTNKALLADISGDPTSQITQMVHQVDPKVTVSTLLPYGASGKQVSVIIVGQKAYQNDIPFLPSQYRFTVTQALNASLLGTNQYPLGNTISQPFTPPSLTPLTNQLPQTLSPAIISFLAKFQIALFPSQQYTTSICGGGTITLPTQTFGTILSSQELLDLQTNYVNQLPALLQSIYPDLCSRQDRIVSATETRFDNTQPNY